MGATVIRPGSSTTLLFPYAMHPGMGGPHHFEVRVETNDPARPLLVFHVLANSVERRR